MVQFFFCALHWKEQLRPAERIDWAQGKLQMCDIAGIATVV